MKIQKITTPRLYLDLLQPQDASRLFDYRSLPEVYTYQSWQPGDVGEVMRFIQRYSGNTEITRDEWKQFGIYLSDLHRLIGDCGLILFQEAQAEIGYTIAPDSQRRGFGSEAAGGLVGFLFDVLGVHRVIARADPHNQASINLLRSLGFRHEGRSIRSTLVRGQWQDDVLFAILEDEWRHKEAG
jgi:RimJ/RimL family protein N-acetyltransferase